MNHVNTLKRIAYRVNSKCESPGIRCHWKVESPEQIVGGTDGQEKSLDDPSKN